MGRKLPAGGIEEAWWGESRAWLSCCLGHVGRVCCPLSGGRSGGPLCLQGSGRLDGQVGLGGEGMGGMGEGTGSRDLASFPQSVG